MINVWDWDKGTGDDFLGRATLTAERIKSLKDQQVWISLEEARKGKVRLGLNN